jgi:hypothetical protein
MRLVRLRIAAVRAVSFERYSATMLQAIRTCASRFFSV